MGYRLVRGERFGEFRDGPIDVCVEAVQLLTDSGSAVEAVNIRQGRLNGQQYDTVIGAGCVPALVDALAKYVEVVGLAGVDDASK